MSLCLFEISRNITLDLSLLFNMHEVDEVEENSLSLRIRKVVKKVVRLLGESEL